MHRFFVPAALLRGDGPVLLEGDLAHQLLRVLRVREGEHLTLLDGSGWASEVEVQRLDARAVEVRVVARTQPATEPRVRLVLYQALPKHRKFDWILQKGTELGVSAFVPLYTRYSDVRERGGEEEGKLARWRRIVTEAAEQSGRVRLPEVQAPQPFAAACTPPPEGALALMPYVAEGDVSLSRLLSAWAGAPPEEVRLYIGPEGGFSVEEAALAREAGVRTVSLGPRILRSETAALAAAAVVLFALGEMDRGRP